MTEAETHYRAGTIPVQSGKRGSNRDARQYRFSDGSRLVWYVTRNAIAFGNGDLLLAIKVLPHVS